VSLRVRADFARIAWVPLDQQHWIASPEPGVDRVMLDRVGDETAVATSIVRYRSGSRFAAHRHDRGEEFLVLDGVFADENGSYPAGTYVRNPPGSAHSPRSDEGCVLFVKLRQFLADDLRPVVIDTVAIGRTVANGTTRVHRLHKFGTEDVALLDGGTGAEYAFERASVPRELLMLSGCAQAGQHRLYPRAWLRVPAHSPLELRFVEAGRVFVKTRPVLEG
jgi:anti-sigma factor ChrR (cupin superfamily)